MKTKNFWNRKKRNLIISPFFFLFPLSLMSCGYSSTYKGFLEYSKKIKDINFEKANSTFDLNVFNENLIKKAKIIKWIDGDTVKVEFNENIKNKKEWNLRINSIDTPEIHHKDISGNWVDTKGKEYEWSKKSKDFGSKEMPLGSEIKVFTEKDISYNRIVGNLFYQSDNKKYKNYSVEILREGLAMPFFNDDVSKTLNKGSFMNVVGVSLADAYNDSIKNLRGIFSEDIEEILKTHGFTSDSRIRYSINKYSSNEKNIYEINRIEY